MTWSYATLPATPTGYDVQVLITADNSTLTDTISNASLLAFLPVPNALPPVLSGTYGSAAAAAEALMQVARVRMYAAAGGDPRAWGWSIALAAGKITFVVGHDGATTSCQGFLEIEFRHSMIR